MNKPRVDRVSIDCFYKENRENIKKQRKLTEDPTTPWSATMPFPLKIYK